MAITNNTNNTTLQEYLDYLESQKQSNSDIYKSVAEDLAKDTAKDYGKYYLLSGGGDTANAANEVSQALWNSGASLGNTAESAELANEATQAAWNQAGLEAGNATGESLLSQASPYLGAATALYGAYNTGNAMSNGGEGIRSGMGTLGAGIGTMLAPGIGTVVGAIIGNGLGYGMDKLGLYHTTTAQRQQERRDRLAEDSDNSYSTFSALQNDADTQAEVQANMDKAYANTADDYVGWYDDPDTAENEWTWVNKQAPQEGFNQNDLEYQKQLGSGDIMWMPDFFENIPNWADLSMEQRDKIASKALELGTAQEGGLVGNAGDIDISDSVWENGLKDYADSVINGTSDSTDDGGDVATNTNSSLSTTSDGYPIGVVGNIFFPGDGSAPVYIGNYNQANSVNTQLQQAQALANLSSNNAWGNAATAFLAPYLGLDSKKDDDKKEKNTVSSLFNNDTNLNNLLGSSSIPSFNYQYNNLLGL